MKPLRISLLALGAVLWLGCSQTDEPLAPSVNSTENLPTSLPPADIVELQNATTPTIQALKDAINALPNSAINHGNRTAMLARLSALDAEIARGNIQQAMHHLLNLRRWVEGCTSATGKPRNGTDKVNDCPAQLAIRALVDDVMDALIDKADTTPDVTINQASGQADPTTTSPILFTVVFSEPVTGFTASDVSFTGSTAGGTVAAAVSGSGDTYTVSVSGMTSSGNVVASVPAAAAVDADNNPTLASTSTDNSVRFNSPPPTVTINQAVGQADPTTGGPITFTVTFSKPVTGFTASDISFTGSTAAGTLVAAISGSGPVYTVTVTGMTGNGTVVASIPASAVTDSDNQPNAASTSTDNTVTLTAGTPGVTINQAAGQIDPTTSTPVLFTVQFSEPVTGFTAADVLFTGSTATGMVATVTGSGALYTVSVAGMTTSGTVVVTIPAGAATNAGGTATTASTSTDNTVTYTKP
jgi:hypothetical protein